ncbi:MAG: hypothetical protein ACI83P_001517 [Janthinobacterium sp.]|jgi:hypothetical protein
MRIRLVHALLLVAALCAPASAGVPPHAPGTICATPKFWCWAIYPGPPGARCACPVQQRFVAGVLI